MSTQVQASQPVRGRKWRAVAAALALTLSASWVGVMVFLALALRADVRSLQALVEQPPQQIKLSEAQQLVHQTHQHSAALRGWASPMLQIAPALRWVPRYGADIAAAGDLLDLAVNLTQAADESLLAFAPLLDAANSPASGTDITRALSETLPSAMPHLQTAAAALERAGAARSRIEAHNLTPGLQGPLAQLDRYLPVARSALALAQSLPDLLGLERPQSYLLLAQNQDELRPTGGFISGAGLLTVSQGQIAEFRLEDAYAVDDFTQGPYPAPPEPLRRYMGSELWVFRDVNWSPDFPTSAQDAAALYQLGQGLTVDGVIAFEQTAIQLLLTAIGPVTVPGAPEPISADNVIRYMREAWSTSPGEGVSREWYAHRKDFMATLGKAIVAQVKSTRDPARVAALARAMLAMLDERHLVIYAMHPTLATRLAEAGWDGSVQPGGQDYVMVVDANVGFNKVNAVIQESLQYTVNLSDPAQPKAALSVRYQHTASAHTSCQHTIAYVSGQYTDEFQRCYWDYWRILAPAGAHLISAPDNQVPGEELMTGQPDYDPARVSAGAAGVTEIAGIFVLPLNQVHETPLTYVLPATVLDESTPGLITYRLHVQKQPGTDAPPVAITINYPATWAMKNSSMPAAANSPGLLRYDLTLKTDVNLEVVFQTTG